MPAIVASRQSKLWPPPVKIWQIQPWCRITSYNRCCCCQTTSERRRTSRRPISPAQRRYRRPSTRRRGRPSARPLPARPSTWPPTCSPARQARPSSSPLTRRRRHSIISRRRRRSSSNRCPPLSRCTYSSRIPSRSASWRHPPRRINRTIRPATCSSRRPPRHTCKSVSCRFVLYTRARSAWPSSTGRHDEYWLRSHHC